ncbi:MAG: hypothetical protein ABR585_10510 [Gemmatimonadaceae bacterium]
MIKMLDWRRAAVRAVREIRLASAARLLLAASLSTLNVLWRGHGVLRSSPTLQRFVIVALVCYIVTAIAEFVWLVCSPLPLTSSDQRNEIVPALDLVDPLVEQLKDLPPAKLKEETLQLASEMKTFEAGRDQEFVSSLVAPPHLEVSPELRDEQLDKQSVELVQGHLLTWRAYREKFYRPARAFRDELRKRLGIRNTITEPKIPALDQAILTGANPISQAADYLVALARRLK